MFFLLKKHMFLSRCVQKNAPTKMRGVNPPSPPDVNVGVLFRVGTLRWNFGAFFLQHLLDASLQLTNIEHGGARGLWVEGRLREGRLVSGWERRLVFGRC